MQLSWPVTEERLRAAYRRLALTTHPDRGGSHAEFVEVQNCFEAVLAAIQSGAGRPSDGWVAEEEDGGETTWETAYRRFRAGFRRSRKSNLWRRWGRFNVTVFPSRFGGYCYCIADSDGPAFSNYSHDSEDEAILSVWHCVGDI
jgi:hypothetical protein